MRLPWEYDDQSQETNWRHCVTGPELPLFHKRKGILKIDQSVKMPWHRLSMGVACSWSSAPVQSHYACKMCSSQHFRDKTKSNICHHMLTSSTQLHVVERTRTSAKCPKMKNARAKRAKRLFYVIKYANLWRSFCRRRRGWLSPLMSSENANTFGYQFTLAQWSLCLRRLDLPLHLRLQSERAFRMQT